MALTGERKRNRSGRFYKGLLTEAVGKLRVRLLKKKGRKIVERGEKIVS